MYYGRFPTGGLSPLVGTPSPVVKWGIFVLNTPEIEPRVGQRLTCLATDVSRALTRGCHSVGRGGRALPASFIGRPTSRCPPPLSAGCRTPHLWSRTALSRSSELAYATATSASSSSFRDAPNRTELQKAKTYCRQNGRARRQNPTQPRDMTHNHTEPDRAIQSCVQ